MIVNIGLFGPGTVGSGVIEILNNNRDKFAEKHNINSSQKLYSKYWLSGAIYYLVSIVILQEIWTYKCY